VHFRKTSNTLDASVQSEHVCFQKSAEVVSGDNRISQIMSAEMTPIISIKTVTFRYIPLYHCAVRSTSQHSRRSIDLVKII